MITKEEAQVIIDALLFSSSVDIVADWGDDKEEKFIKVAQKLAKEFKASPSKDICLFGSNYEKASSKKLKKIFPKLRTEK